ncbi:MAG: hypothetical protein GX897_07415 [Clostridiales bacterium]|nr:hypothetical protein [Clostridiales bacterium]
MKISSRTSLIILAAALLAAFILSACGSKPAETAAPDGAKSDGGAAETTEAATEPPYDFLKYPQDFGGRTFTVLKREIAEPIDLDESVKRGDVIIEAIHERNLNTEELLNIKLKSVNVVEVEDLNNKLSAAVLANTGEFDAAFPFLEQIAKVLPNHYLMDFREVESIDLDNPWWDQTTIETFDFDSGKVYMINGEICYTDDLSTICLYFNKDLFRNTNIEFPYDKVREGKWTFDAFREIEKDGYLDLNGNGEEDEHDRYGYVTNGSNAFNMVVGMGSLTTRKTGEGEIEFVLDDAYFTKFDLAVGVISNSPSTVIVERKFGYDLGGQIFGFGNTYFAYNTIGACLSYRSLDFDIGVVPFPKYDENQEKYYGLSNTGGAPVYTLPIGCDAEFSGAVLEAMGYFATPGLTEAAIDQSVLIKGVRDEDSYDMFKIIFASKVYDLVYTLDWGGYYGKTIGIVMSGNNKLASTYASVKKSVDKAMDKYIEAIREGAAG